MIDTRAHLTSTKKRSRWVLPLVLVTGLVLATAAVLLWFFGGEAPGQVDLATTASSLVIDDAVATAGSAEDIEGTWIVDTSIGVFTVADDTTATFVGFRVEEVLDAIGSTTAVGRTHDVTGSITIEGTTLTSAEVVADLTGIVSDESRREDSIQRALNTSSFPVAGFVLTEPVELGDQAADGELVSTTATGSLTVNGVTRLVEIDLAAQLVDDMILVTGSTEVFFDDYDVSTPTAPAVVSVEDHGIVEVQLWLSK